MPTQKKNTKQSSTTKSVSRKKKSEPVEQAVAATEVVAPVEVAEESTPEGVSEASPVDENSWEYLEGQFKAVLTQLNDSKNAITIMQSNVKKLQKSVQRSLKENSKRSRRKQQSADKPKRALSGFAKPALISPALCAFLDVDQGTEMARTEVTKHLTQYIKNNSLQDEQNKRRILVDQKLGDLLGVSGEDEVTYFNLQKYMKVHFPKSAATLLAEAQAQAQVQAQVQVQASA